MGASPKVAAYTRPGNVTMLDSAVTGNRAALKGALPGTVEQFAIGGGLQLADDVPAIRIEDTRIAGNRCGRRNGTGDAQACWGA